MKTRKSYSCELCGHHVHPTSGTIFHKSSTSLTLWFYAIFLVASTRSGISAKQLEGELGVTYKTAWRMMKQIRSMMNDDSGPLSGEIEVDEAYLQPDPTRRSTVTAHQSQVLFGMVERGGKAKIKHVKSSGARVLMPEITANIDPSSTIYSDEWAAYKKLPSYGYNHETIKHQELDYVRGKVHTQNVENLWSGFKRGFKGVYIHCDPKYLQNYVDEYAFRYSHRKHESMFWAIMNRVSPS